MNKNLISILDLDKTDILEIFNIAQKREHIVIDYKNILEGKILCSLFFQQSTRTQLSFQSAFLRLGGTVIGFSNAESSRSSAPYFEDAYDLGQIVSIYSDIAVMRTVNQIEINNFVKKATIPLISGGSAHNEHPTQALIDLFTINQYLHNINNIHILIIGSLTHRTNKSLLMGLNNWNNINVYVIASEKKAFDIQCLSNLENINFKYFDSLDSFINIEKTSNIIDVIYITRFLDNEDLNKSNIFTSEKLSKFKKSVIILDPLPRSSLLPFEIDSTSNAKYFKQAENGLYIREALFVYYYKNKLL